MTTCRTFDPYLEDLHHLERLADPEPASEGRAVVWVLVLALVMTLAAGATWATRAGGPPPEEERSRGNPGEGGTVVTLVRAVPASATEAAETARATGEESGLGSPGVGAR